MIIQQPQLQPPPIITNQTVQGDPGARNFGIFFLSALAIITLVGAGVGIGVGNIAHYRYFAPTNATYNVTYEFFNVTNLRAEVPVEAATGQLLKSIVSVKKRLIVKRSESTQKGREFWLSMNKP